MSEVNDEKMERARQWLTDLLDLMAMSAAVSVRDDTLEIDAAQLDEPRKDLLLGRDGATLDALQYLANAVLNLHVPKEEQQAYTVELDGYRQRREAELREMTEAAVAQVRETQKEYEMQPLSAAERRQVHMLLKTDEYADVETFSRGKEPHRRLVVRPASGEPEES
ncbi:MAG: R3H domain-containing nucleic acid-binding protein [Cyanobacteria bacterium J06639_1]